MKYSKLLLSLSLILLIGLPSANAFTLFGIDFGKLWSEITSITESTEKEEAKKEIKTEAVKKAPKKTESAKKEKPKVTPKKTSSDTKKSTSKKTSKPKESKPKKVVKKPELNVSLDNVIYTQAALKGTINTQENVKAYVKGFAYECIYIETTQGNKFTIHFDTQKGEMTKLELKKNCDRKIELDETLITDFKSNGFQASQIKTYLGKVDLPTSTYFKALKVFTVG